MHNILFVGNGQNYFSLSIKEQLQALDYRIIATKPETDEVSKVKESISALLLFVDEAIVGKQQNLIFIKDKAVEGDMPIFLIGDAEEMNEAKKYLPESLIKKEFARPIDVKDIVKTVDNYVRYFGNHLKRKVLVVDDSGAMLRNVKGWLEESYDVALANSGAMAIKYLALNRPDLILLDYEMPVCDGKQVLEMIRSEMEFSDVPVIFLTSKSDRESVMQVMDLKPDGYLLKTMKPQEIVKAVDDFFEKRKVNV